MYLFLLLPYVWIGTPTSFPSTLRFLDLFHSISCWKNRGEKLKKKELTCRTEQRRKQKKKEKKQEKDMWMGTSDTTVVNGEKTDMVFRG